MSSRRRCHTIHQTLLHWEARPHGPSTHLTAEGSEDSRGHKLPRHCHPASSLTPSPLPEMTLQGQEKARWVKGKAATVDLHPRATGDKIHGRGSVRRDHGGRGSGTDLEGPVGLLPIKLRVRCSQGRKLGLQSHPFGKLGPKPLRQRCSYTPEMKCADVQSLVPLCDLRQVTEPFWASATKWE